MKTNNLASRLTRWSSALIVASTLSVSACDDSDAEVADEDVADEHEDDVDGDGDGDGDESGDGDEADGPEALWDVHSVIVIDYGYVYDVISGSYNYSYGYRTLWDDGTVFRGFLSAHYPTFDAELAQSEDPDAWGLWQMDGDVLELSSDDGEFKAVSDWFPLDVPAPGERLEGTYEVLGAITDLGGTGDFFGTGWTVVTFSKDGRFEESSGGSVTGPNGVALGSEQTRGSYEIDGAELTLHFDDGTTTQNTLLFSSPEEKIIFINGVEFIRG